MKIEDRLWARVEIDDKTGCWNWTGFCNAAGYGLFWIGSKEDGRSYRVHRIAYELWVGEIENGNTVDHLCFNKVCVNPDHLDQCSRGENTRRAKHKNGAAKNREKKMCPRGHRYNKENTALYYGRRYCKKCRAINLRNFKARKKALEE